MHLEFTCFFTLSNSQNRGEFLFAKWNSCCILDCGPESEEVASTIGRIFDISSCDRPSFSHSKRPSRAFILPYMQWEYHKSKQYVHIEIIASAKKWLKQRGKNIDNNITSSCSLWEYWSLHCGLRHALAVHGPSWGRCWWRTLNEPVSWYDF